MFAKLSPSFPHSFTPMNIIKNYYRFISQIVFQHFKIPQSRIILMVSINKDQIENINYSLSARLGGGGIVTLGDFNDDFNNDFFN